MVIEIWVSGSSLVIATPLKLGLNSIMKVASKNHIEVMSDYLCHLLQLGFRSIQRQKLEGHGSKGTLSKKNTPAKRCENNVAGTMGSPVLTTQGGTLFKIIPSARTFEK